MTDRTNKSEHIENLAKALCAAQAELQPVPLNSKNPFLGNKYADLGATIEAAKSVIARHGLSISQLITGDDHNIGVTTILMHDSGEWLETTVTLAVGDEKGKSRAQVAGSIATYLRRYSYSAILGMSTEEDTDGNEPRRSQAKQQKQPTTEPTVTSAANYWGSRRAALIGRLKTIPYYGGNVPHVIASLNKLTESGEVKTDMPDEQVYTIVQEHAKKAADKEAE